MNIVFLKIALIIVLVLYTLALLFILLFSLAQAHLLFRYLKSKKKKEKVVENVSFEPFVSVQLPVYNELYVVERLIDAVAKFNYPKDKFEIQVLDDSNDNTVQLIKKKVVEWKNKGIDIVHIQREKRTGFKAGALKYGLEKAKGEFIAIFDADFIPNPDFIRNTISHFSYPKLGMVQTRWEYLNRNYSMLTTLQAFALDTHFSVEQVGRNESNSFINFNGTGGIWRKTCIIDAGNWEGDTLTEDLDLSYRAQLKGWKFKYLDKINSPAELPPVMSALKSQQYRWTKGGAETARKHLANVLKSDFPFTVKFHALFHLLNSAVFISIFVAAISSIPLLLLKPIFPEFSHFYAYATVFLLSFIIISLVYFISCISGYSKQKRPTLYFLKTFPIFLSVSMGLSLHNAVAVLEGYYGKKTPFIRTPKFNIQNNNDSWKGNMYISRNLNLNSFFEGFLALYFTFGIYYSFIIQDFSLILFHVMLTIGFGLVFYFSVFQTKYK